MWNSSAARGDADAGRTPFGIHLAVGAAVMVGACIAAAALFPDVSGRLVVVALAVGAYAGLVDDTRASLAVAGLGYLLFTGFLVNRYGELTWDGTTSTWHLTVFALAIGLGLSRRWIRAVRAKAALTAELEVLINNTESRKKESHGG